MPKDFKNEWNGLTQGSKLSKFLFVSHWILLGITVFSFIAGQWKFGLLFLGLAGLSIFFSYRLAGGRQNPIIWKDKSQHEEITPQKVPNYLFWAILATFWFIPFGIIAIVYASQVRAFLRSGDYSRAIDASKKAKKWCWFSFMAGLVIAILALLLQSLVP